VYVRRALGPSLLLIVTVFAGAAARPAAARSHRGSRHAGPPSPPAVVVLHTGRVAVQPFDGDAGPAVRQQIARMLRERGYRVVTSVARVDGTGQYLTLARDHRLAAFVTGDMEEGKRRCSVTFLVWNGATGAVLGRWSASAPPKKLATAIGKGFWKHLGPALDEAQPPPSNDLPPAPPMRIDAGQVD
jgi:hypothetical protein